MDNALVLDFKDIEAAQGGVFVTPGQYWMYVEKVELGNNKSGTHHLATTFVRKSDDAKFVEKFHLEGKNPQSTRTLLGRLQYIHEAWTGSKLNKTFTSYEEMATYFNGCLHYGEKAKPVVVGGNFDEESGRIWAKLPFTDFILDEKDFVEEEYEEGTPAYKKVVTKQKSTAPANDYAVTNTESGDGGKFPWEE